MVWNAISRYTIRSNPAGYCQRPVSYLNQQKWVVKLMPKTTNAVNGSGRSPIEAKCAAFRDIVAEYGELEDVYYSSFMASCLTFWHLFAINDVL
jgi:hypothetical protein